MRSRYAFEEANLRVVQHERSRVRAKLDELGGAPPDPDRVRRVLGNFELMYDVANAEERKELLRLLVRRIDFYGRGEDVCFELSADVDFPDASSISRRQWLPVVGGARTWKFSQSSRGERVEQQPDRELDQTSRATLYAAALASEPGISRAEIARRFGVSRSAVTQALRRK